MAGGVMPLCLSHQVQHDEAFEHYKRALELLTGDKVPHSLRHAAHPSALSALCVQPPRVFATHVFRGGCGQGTGLEREQHTH